MPRETTTQQEHILGEVDQKESAGFSFKKWHEKLSTDSYEQARSALDELEDVASWRKNAAAAPVREIYDLIETRLELARASANEEERTAALADAFDDAVFTARAMTPRVRDVYLAMAAEMTGQAYTQQFESTTKRLEEFTHDGLIAALIDTSVTYAEKQTILDKRLNKFLSGQLALDRRRQEIIEEKEVTTALERPHRPPPARDQSKPSMDEMERLKEGEPAPAMWTIEPARGGYFREQSFDTWDAEKNEWVQSQYQYQDVSFPNRPDAEYEKEQSMRLTAEIQPNQWTRIPRPRGYRLSRDTSASSGTLVLQQDQNGDVVCLVQGDTAHDIACTIEFVPSEWEEIPDQTPSPKFIGVLSSETEAKLADIASRKKDNVSRARALAVYTMRRLTYSNESKYNAIYDQHPGGYIAAIEEHGKADCDVANTYFAALCSRLDISVRHVVGHMVKGKDEHGASRITSGTGHAWSEVWDDVKNDWERIDATPPGDPLLEKDDEKKSGEAIPGDYGGTMARLPTDAELEALRQKLAEHVTELSYTAEERSLAEATGIELAEARQIVKEIRVAEDERLPTRSRERVLDVLSLLFRQIVEMRKKRRVADKGPVTMDEGGEEIEDIVAHGIAVRAGKIDPPTRLRPDEEEITGPCYGGFDVYLIGDKSGSMSGMDEDGEEKWKMQRRAEYLIFGALHTFGHNADHAGLRPNHEQALSIRTEGISFRGDGPADIDLDKPLGSAFVETDKVHLWHSLTKQGTGNGDTAALSYIYEQIKQEIVAEVTLAKQTGKSLPQRLRLVIACSDGMPDSETGVHDTIKCLGELGCVVVGIGLTETASQVPIIFDTPYSRGDYAKTIADLPVIVAKHVVREAIKLFPPELQQVAEKQVTAILAKFVAK